ncbi:hypothetical protein BCF44_13911 [Kutzneria buriramensis]|uniref:Streptogrisin C n=2 Tax=Kutzneria buriramensis TaxID=1045776 RepID=A0A3E0G684_9PSEU|nr:hypothetical protein BCF44_13911 [Kutzneria buriramensis]
MTLGVIVACVAAVGLTGSQALAAVSDVHQQLLVQSQELTEASVAALRRDLGLSESEARRRVDAQAGVTALADNLAARLGDRQAGSWLDPADGALVVNVVDDLDARTVENAGARAQIVRYTTAELERVATELGHGTLPRGSSWGVDPRVDAVVVELPAGAAFTPVRDYGDAVVVHRSAGPARTLATDLYGGLTINRDRPGGGSCTSGFVATDANPDGFGLDYLLTAGHCGVAGSTWWRGGQKIGYISQSEFGPDDYASIVLTNYTAWQPRGWVYTRNGPQAVTGSGTVTVTGTTVCMRGSSTAYNCGQVLAFNQSYTDSRSGVTVTGLDRTSLCSVAGDSGAPVMVAQSNGVIGVGMVSGGAVTSTGQCQRVNFIEPLWKVLNGIKLVTSN